LDRGGDTFRAVYTVRWPGRVYVLHVFKKKSTAGVGTPKSDINLIDGRLKRLREHHEAAKRVEEDER
jgi:phage-related protein